MFHEAIQKKIKVARFYGPRCTYETDRKIHCLVNLVISIIINIIRI